jgi:hypothetical protein
MSTACRKISQFLLVADFEIIALQNGSILLVANFEIIALENGSIFIGRGL